MRTNTGNYNKLTTANKKWNAGFKEINWKSLENLFCYILIINEGLNLNLSLFYLWIEEIFCENKWKMHLTHCWPIVMSI